MVLTYDEVHLKKMKEDENEEFETDEEETEMEQPDFENDAVISSDGNKLSVSFAGKHLKNVVEDDEALALIKEQMKKQNWYPSIWFVSDHGNYWPIDQNGNEIKFAKGGEVISSLEEFMKNRRLQKIQKEGHADNGKWVITVFHGGQPHNFYSAKEKPADAWEDIFEAYQNRMKNGNFKRGGNLSRDRKFKSQQPWEQAYSRLTSPKNPHYKKHYGKGGITDG
jgi:hypothetical protein